MDIFEFIFTILFCVFYLFHFNIILSLSFLASFLDYFYLILFPSFSHPGCLPSISQYLTIDSVHMSSYTIYTFQLSSNV